MYVGDCKDEQRESSVDSRRYADTLETTRTFMDLARDAISTHTTDTFKQDTTMKRIAKKTKGRCTSDLYASFSASASSVRRLLNSFGVVMLCRLVIRHET